MSVIIPTSSSVALCHQLFAHEHTGDRHPLFHLDSPDAKDAHYLFDAVTYHPNGEVKVSIKRHIRHKRVYILAQCADNNRGEQDARQEYVLHQKRSTSVNDCIMEVMNIIDACKRSDAKSICVIVPYFPYARSDKKDDGRCAIGAAMVTRMLETAGANRIVCLDLHSAQIQGFASVPFDNLYAIGLFCDYITDTLLGSRNKDDFILVSPDQGGAKRVQAYAARLDMEYAIMHKQRSRGVNGIESISLLTTCDVKGKTAILVDDMVDTCGTMVAACNFLKTKGLAKCVIMATHGVLSGPALDRINGCDMISQVIVTNSQPMWMADTLAAKLVVLDICPLLSQVIARLNTGGSLSELFR